MTPLLAALAYTGLIAAFFWFDRDEEVRTSGALWVPVAWLLLNGSRPVSAWMQTGVAETAAASEGSPLDAAVYAAIIATGVVVLCTRGRQLVNFVRNNPVLLVFLAYCLVSTIWADDSLVSFKRWIKSVGDVIMIVIVLSETDQVGAIKRFLCRSGYVLVPLSVLFIKYFPEYGRTYNPWTWEPMYSGVTTFKNLLGMTTLVCALGTLWCFLRSWRELTGKRRWQHMAVEATVIGMSIWLFLTADSMTSFSCFMLAGTVMVVANLPFAQKHTWVIHVAVAGAITIAIVALFFDSSGGMVAQLGRNSSLTGRTAIWAVVVQLAQRSPWLGAGFESFWMGDRLATVWRLEKGIQEAHDGYLEVYANLGWVGITILACLIVTGYRRVMEVFARNVPLGTIKLGFLVATLIYSLTEAGFRMMSPVWLGFLLAVTTITPRRLVRKPASVVPRVAKERPEAYASFATSYKEGF